MASDNVNKAIPLISIDPLKCKKCGICVQCCPDGVLLQKKPGTIPAIEYEFLCIRCGQCAAICPAEAIQHKDYPPETLHPVRQDLIPSPEQIEEFLRSRRTIRTFLDKPVERQKLEQILLAARYGGSTANQLSTNVVVVQDKTIIAKVRDAIAASMTRWVNQCQGLPEEQKRSILPMITLYQNHAQAVREGRDVLMRDAPALLVFHATAQSPFLASADANVALVYAQLMAYALGIGAYYVGYAVTASQLSPDIPNILEIPPANKIYGVLALGYPKFRFKKRMDRKTLETRWI